jgi:hypothetical protein
MTPIALFVYNRPRHTERTLKALAKNRGAAALPLTIFSDAPRTQADAPLVAEVRAICAKATGFASVSLVERDKNFGLAQNIITGVTGLMANYDSVIVLEDDLETAEGFLEYMQAALAHYRPEPVFSVCGYCPPIKIPTGYAYSTFMAQRNGSWGWGTWKDRWESVDWHLTGFDRFFADKKDRKRFALAGNDLPMMLLKQKLKIINSWSIRFCFSSYKQNLPTVYPIASLVKNSGVDGSGTHMKRTDRYSVQTANQIDATLFCPSTTHDEQIKKRFKRFYDTSLYRRSVNLAKTYRYLYLSSSK